MSILEWILYPTIAVIVVAYGIHTIYRIKHPKKKKVKNDQEDETSNNNGLGND